VSSLHRIWHALERHLNLVHIRCLPVIHVVHKNAVCDQAVAATAIYAPASYKWPQKASTHLQAAHQP